MNEQISRGIKEEMHRVSVETGRKIEGKYRQAMAAGWKPSREPVPDNEKPPDVLKAYQEGLELMNAINELFTAWMAYEEKLKEFFEA